MKARLFSISVCVRHYINCQPNNNNNNNLHSTVSHISTMDVLYLTQQCISYINHGCYLTYTTMCIIHQSWMFCSLHNNMSHTLTMDVLWRYLTHQPWLLRSLHNNVSHTSAMDVLWHTQQCVSYISHGCYVAYTTMCFVHQP